MSQQGSYLNAKSGFLQAPRGAAGQPSSWFQRFWAKEILDPAKLIGNATMVWGVSFFALGILFFRKAGFVLVPAF
ncbi:hypothetical protein MVES1_001290 [Malassezia vespertilionis]|uniref:Uncharacterized protein n=1 Tax=Malassezia vespertilionis TaxID=2020962 RepID=A0A2N1JF39_9BASI|nr:uncharacterized protein MVES1_001290 [Malassezia vespertilionis]PKI85150.1 hypothetical protein MVES_001212 [Malassezia vespertilionis]WFD05954.1 hypothetical protein MVES1_001290 [Malassezia vespertilionis]